ncbi:MAG: phage major capsid protein [Devosia sp.]
MNDILPKSTRTWLDGKPYSVKDDASLAPLVKSIEDNNKAIDERLDGLKKGVDEVGLRQFEIEQRIVSMRGNPGTGRAETLGELAIKGRGEEIAAIGRSRGRLAIPVKATLTSLTTDAAGSVGDLAVADRPGFILPPRRKLRMRDLFAPGQTSAGALEWPKMTGRTNGAETQTEAATKGQSDMKFDLIQWPVRTIAHWMIASKQILDDAPALKSVIDSELTYGVKYVEDAQLLAGGGTGTDLTGVYTSASAYAAPFVPDGVLTFIDILLLAIAQVEDADYEADGIVLNPLDWRYIQSLKDDESRYLGGGPFTMEDLAKLWSMPVVTTKAMTQDKFLVGAFRAGAQIFDREECIVEISTEDSDNFRKNLVTLRAEERLAFVIKHADAFVKGDFGDAITG